MSSNNPTLCLNMIVKNESSIITRLLDSVLPIIDSYCICDTGCTDNTIEVMRTFFEKHNKKGKFVNEPFRDFGYNRSFALKACESIDVKYGVISMAGANAVEPERLKTGCRYDVFDPCPNPPFLPAFSPAPMPWVF